MKTLLTILLNLLIVLDRHDMLGVGRPMLD